MRRAQVLLAVVLAGWVALAGAREAHAWWAKGRPWPGGTIRYANEATDQRWAVNRAVTAWNTSGARVRFVPSSRAAADIVIRHLPNGDCGTRGYVLGRANVGYTPGSVVYIRPRDDASLGCNRFAAATAVAHELGHVLGLAHEDRYCALMNRATSLYGPSRCEPTSPYDWRCQLLTADDVAGAVRLYGGVAREPRGPENCRLWSPIGRPGVLQARYAGASGVELSFTRPRSADLPAFVQESLARRGRRAVESYAFTSARERCPTIADIRSARRLAWTVRPGARVTIHDRVPPPGRYCYAVWALDGVGAPSSPALFVVAIPPA